MTKTPHVLIVDDEPDMCWALENTLQLDGHQVIATLSGGEAICLLADHNFDLAFVDAKLNDIDGLELAALIRQQNPRTAIVLISGYFFQEDPVIAKGLREGLFAGFVAKPFDLAEIRAWGCRTLSPDEIQ